VTRELRVGGDFAIIADPGGNSRSKAGASFFIMIAPGGPLPRRPGFGYTRGCSQAWKRNDMAETHAITDGHSDMDYAEHERTYVLFLKMAKYGVIFVICLLIFMAIVLL
jgi:hypothetical protein